MQTTRNKKKVQKENYKNMKNFPCKVEKVEWNEEGCK